MLWNSALAETQGIGLSLESEQMGAPVEKRNQMKRREAETDFMRNAELDRGVADVYGEEHPVVGQAVSLSKSVQLSCNIRGLGANQRSILRSLFFHAFDDVVVGYPGDEKS